MSEIADDLKIFLSTEEEYDKAFIQVIEAARENNIEFNSAMIQFKWNKVCFYGLTYWTWFAACQR